MDSSELQNIIKNQNVAKANASQLLEAFGAPFEEAGELLSTYKSIEVTSEDDKKSMTEAREKRLKLRSVRLDVENRRKELKEDSLRVGQAIDGVAKYVRETIEPAEEYLSGQEKFAELRQAERDEQLRAERLEKLSVYVEDVSVYGITTKTTDEQFDAIFAGAKSQYEAKIAAEKRAEEDRLAAEKAEREEQERVRKENEKLRKEAEEREAKAKAEAEKREKAEAEESKKREAEEAKRLETERKERAKLQAEADAKLKAERVERQKLEDEAKAREKAEREEREAIEAEEQALKSAGDTEKMARFGGAIEVIRREKLPVMESVEYRTIVNKIDEHLKAIQELCNAKE